jgi:chaperonin GroES
MSVSLDSVLKADNIVEILSEEELTSIQQFNHQIFTLDKQSREEKEKDLKKFVKLAMLVAEEKSTPWENAANVKYPLIAQAALDFGSKCYPEIIKDNYIVKPKIIGNDEGQAAVNINGVPLQDEAGQEIMQNVGVKEQRGQRVSEFMNWQLFEEIDNFECDMDVLCNSLPVVGCMFKKVFFDSSQDKACSELIYPDKIIINNKAKNLYNATITHIIELYPHEVVERIRAGIFVDFQKEESDDEKIGVIVNDENQQNLDDDKTSNNTEVFLEQHCYLDLDDDGYQEPYIVTIHQQSNEIVRIVKRFDKQDIEYNGKEVKRINPKHYFVKYDFLPSIDGSFYGVGIAHLLFNINETMNSTINQLLDAGTLNNTGGGFIGRGVKIAGGQISLRPGEWKMADVGGGSLKENIVPIPHPQPSTTSFQLLGLLNESGNTLAALNDVLDGQNAANIAPTTILTMVEQGIKKFKSVYKRIHRSLKKEINLIYDLNSEHLTQKKYAKVLDIPVKDANKDEDFNLDDYDIVPVSDIESVTNMQKLAKANFLSQFINDPYIDQMLLREQILDAANIEDIDKLLVQPPAPEPDPLVQMEMEKNKVRAQELEIKSIQAQSDIEKMKFDIEKEKAEIAEIKTKSLLNIAKTEETNVNTDLATVKQQLEILTQAVESRAKSNNGELENDRQESTTRGS